MSDSGGVRLPAIPSPSPPLQSSTLPAPPSTSLPPPRRNKRRRPRKSAASEEASTASPKPAKKPPLTHFLSIPLHHAEDLAATLQTFQKEVAGREDLAIPADSVRPVECAHLTLGVMSLLDDDRVEKAKRVLEELDLRRVLEECRGDTTQEQDLVVSLKGLATMSSPKKASVIYTTPLDRTSRLLPFAEKLRQKFVDEGLVVDEKRALKLHCTILNTVYAQGGRRNRDKKERGPLKFDASELMEKYQETVFAEDVKVNAVAVCRMAALERDGVKGAGGYEQVAFKEL